MGTAFTPEEQILIRKDLKKAAKKYLIMYGMRKTSVEQLVAEVGISKGAFYKFYDTKEHLFFDLVEDMHDEMYKGVTEILSDSSISTPLKRLENAILFAYHSMSDTSMLTFLTDELPYVLRKLSSTMIEEHIQSDTLNVAKLLDDVGIHLNYSSEFISSLVRGIISLSRERAIIGEAAYEDVIRFLIHTSCVKLLEDATFDNV
ncbi:MAG: TetR/AcrR family transcriptional regulator [Cellulosilyticum sp.]|nr:TetR/AcrR family transcriptional regulator [Cellulosilyticum sp.]